MRARAQYSGVRSLTRSRLDIEVNSVSRGAFRVTRNAFIAAIIS